MKHHDNQLGSTTCLDIYMPMHAFLFDSQHPELKKQAIYGTPCTQRVVAAIESLIPIPTTRLIRGDILPEYFCFNLNGFALRGNKAKENSLLRVEEKCSDEFSSLNKQPTSSREYRYSPDMNLFKTIICDLAESLCYPPSTAIEEVVLIKLGRSRIWSVGTSNTTDGEATYVDAKLKGYGPYLGMVKIDNGNPVQWKIMVEQMSNNNVIITPEGISFIIEPGLPKEDQEDAEQLATELGSNKAPTVIERGKLRHPLPPLRRPKSYSERGKLSCERLTNKSKITYREGLAWALLNEFEKTPPSEPIEFSTSFDIGIDEFELDQNKFTKYLLNREHPEGGGKAKFFIDKLGIFPEDWRFLADQIKQGMKTAKLYRASKKQWGFSHGAFVAVKGRNGTDAVIKTGWMVQSGLPAKFVTAYPCDSDYVGPSSASKPFVVEPGLTGDAKWQSIYERAIEEGLSEASSVQPTPMVLKEYGTEWDGECGFAWVHLMDGRHPMAKWLLKLDKGYKSRPGVKVFAQTSYQSVERNRAWAEAFASVLKANGVECKVEWQLD